MRYRPDDWGSDEYKKRLNGELKKYKEVMASGLYDCLKAMLELEISALGPKISNKQRENLTKANMSLYRQISIYNIFCRIHYFNQKTFLVFFSFQPNISTFRFMIANELT